MTKRKCTACKAKITKTFPIRRGGHLLCEDCNVEYASILDGILSNKERKRREDSDELFKDFEKGWKSAERDYGLEEIPIPQFIKDLHRRIYEEENKE